MNCAVSSIQPESSTAPACRNISRGERAGPARAASAAARDPSNRRKRQPATSATRSITEVAARSTSSTSRTMPAAAPGTSAASVATAACSTPSVGMMTLSIDGSSMPQRVKRRRTVITLSHSNQPSPLQLFAACPPRRTIPRPPARKLITRHDSPDIGCDRSINPSRGCEHGCVYCFARPTHAFLGLSPGLDFESKLFAKPEAPQLLEKELAAQDYEPRMIAIGTNTDPYQPIERERKIMHGILQVLERASHPAGIVTKSALRRRDIDVLARMAERNLAKVAISVTTLDSRLARTMEPRSSTPTRRPEALRELSDAGILTTVMVA